MEPIDRAALRALAERQRGVVGETRLALTAGDVLRILDALDAAEREADRWRHGVPVEGDYVRPTSLALDQARADLRAYGGHTGTCAYDACDCWLAEALARAEGRDV